MRPGLSALWKYGPLGLIVALILWTALVTPYSKYGDKWAIYPALAILPIWVLWQAAYLIRERFRAEVVVFATIQAVIFAFIWIYCLMRISKDSL